MYAPVNTIIFSINLSTYELAKKSLKFRSDFSGQLQLRILSDPLLRTCSRDTCGDEMKYLKYGTICVLRDFEGLTTFNLRLILRHLPKFMFLAIFASNLSSSLHSCPRLHVSWEYHHHDRCSERSVTPCFKIILDQLHFSWIHSSRL